MINKNSVIFYTPHRHPMAPDGCHTIDSTVIEIDEPVPGHGIAGG